MAEQRWYWWGVLVARDKHAKQRQVYVSPAFDPLSGTGQMGWVVESWSKGLTGKLWSVRQEEYAAINIDGWQADVLGKTARIKISPM